MHCPSHDVIQSYLSGTLKSRQQAEFEQHLQDCSACLDVLSQLAAATPLPQIETTPLPGWTAEVALRVAAGLDEIVTSRDHLPSELNDLRLPLVIDDYELLEVIGRGGMGTVYRARQRRLNRFVAVKMVVQQFLKPSLVDRFYVEARSAGKLDHPGIVPVYDVGQLGQNVFYAMALVTGGTLADALSDGPLPSRRAAEIVKLVADAVQFAHERGVIHRDLKPSNILLDLDGHPKIADFGLAKDVGSGGDLTASGDVLGTPGYMAPEQAGGKDSVTTAADVYGLGAILFHLLTGRAPFEGDDPVAVIYRVVNEEALSAKRFNAHAPTDLDTITLRCLAKRPADRYESAAEVARELHRFLNGEPIHARPLSAFGRTVRWCRRHPGLAMMTATAVTALVAGTGVSMNFGILANRRSENLPEINQRLEFTESQARRSADEAKSQAEYATE